MSLFHFDTISGKQKFKLRYHFAFWGFVFGFILGGMVVTML